MTAKTVFERIKAALRRERAEARDLLDDTTARWESVLERKEREHDENPVERFQRLERDVLDSDPFEAVRARIERTEASEQAASADEPPSPLVPEPTDPDQ